MEQIPIQVSSFLFFGTGRRDRTTSLYQYWGLCGNSIYCCGSRSLVVFRTLASRATTGAGSHTGTWQRGTVFCQTVLPAVSRTAIHTVPNCNVHITWSQISFDGPRPGNLVGNRLGKTCFWNRVGLQGWLVDGGHRPSSQGQTYVSAWNRPSAKKKKSKKKEDGKQAELYE